MQIKSISEHRPKNYIIDLPEEDAKELLATGEFVKLIEEKLVIEKKSEKKSEKKDFAEEEIKKII